MRSPPWRTDRRFRRPFGRCRIGGSPPAVEATAYFVVSEALANVAKHATRRGVSIAATATPTTLRVEVGDDGVGGADAANGTGIRGLQDRVAAIGGTLRMESPAGPGHARVAEIPIG